MHVPMLPALGDYRDALLVVTGQGAYDPQVALPDRTSLVLQYGNRASAHVTASAVKSAGAPRSCGSTRPILLLTTDQYLPLSCLNLIAYPLHAPKEKNAGCFAPFSVNP